ncbi:hypothetical protein Pa4123_45340 [Phytohabitans aurantiacus]|uniref:Uncharacterized protein n=1 Tax=Phytohabitans aurantiacus TaxID=3016789 RepID=A0ABQ5QYJ6_9ACTN|nr:hypothetical protein Pa4123_45340 [Phytohabitans aurantiacus]
MRLPGRAKGAANPPPMSTSRIGRPVCRSNAATVSTLSANSATRSSGSATFVAGKTCSPTGRTGPDGSRRSMIRRAASGAMPNWVGAPVIRRPEPRPFPRPAPADTAFRRNITSTATP